MRPTPVLVTMTGQDRPGVAAVIFAALAAHDVEVRELALTLSRQRAKLTVLVDLRGDTAALRHSVSSTAQAFGVESRVESVEAESTGPAGPTVHVTRRPRARPGRTRTVLVGRPLRAGAIGDVAQRVADAGGNIEAMWQAPGEPISALEMVLAGDAKRLRSALIGAAHEDALDIAVTPAGQRPTLPGLLVLDADVILPAGTRAARLSPRVAAFVREARRAGRRVIAVASSPVTDRLAETLGLDAVAIVDDGTAADAVSAAAARLDVPMSLVVAVGDGRRSARLLEVAGTAIAVDAAAAQRAAADTSGARGFLDSVAFLLARL